ncbi:MAG: CoA-binding protein [Desulfomicrobiaceae bacterium]
MSTQTVAILGASPKPERYSHKALKALMEHGHDVIPVHPARTDIDGIPTARSLDEITRPVDTLTVYVSPTHSLPLAEAIIRLRPGRVILNPGTESPELEARLSEAGIAWQHACTLVLLSTGQF